MSGRAHAMVGWRIRLVGIVAVLVAIGASVVQPAAVAAQDDDVLDLAAMTLTAEDLEREGFANHGMGNGMMTTEPEAVADFIAFWRGEQDDLAEALDEADLERAYLQQIVETGDEGDVFSGTESRVLSSFFAFAGEDEAEDAFAQLAEVWQAGNLEEIEAEQEIGEERILVAGTTRDVSGSRAQHLDLLFRIGAVVSGVSIEVYDATPPEQAALEALAERQQERIIEVIDEGGPGLSGQILRLEITGDRAIFDFYGVRDGTRFYRADETKEEADETQAIAEEAGLVDQYQVDQLVVGDPIDPSAEPTVFFSNRIATFGDEDAASDYLRDSAERLESAGVMDLAPVEDVPDLADEVAAFTYRHERADGVVFNDYRIYVRDGATFFTMAINSTEESEPAVIADIAARQAECLSGEASCLEPDSVPDDLATARAAILAGRAVVSVRRGEP